MPRSSRSKYSTDLSIVCVHRLRIWSMVIMALLACPSWGRHDHAGNRFARRSGRDASVGDQRADRLAGDHAPDVARRLEVEDLDRQVVLHAHREGGEVHDAQLLLERLGEGEGVVAAGGAVEL